MQNVVLNFERSIAENLVYFKSIDITLFEEKFSEEKWSKKQIIGHLIDSAIHNLVRFTEINYAEKPYLYRTYNQNDLVQINQYQEMEKEELIQLWFALNNQIIRIFKSVGNKALEYEIRLTDNSIIDLKFLMTDYVTHLEHHINQIKSI